jgi:hypothetical protein
MTSKVSARGFKPIPRAIRPLPNQPDSDMFDLVPARPDLAEADFEAVVASRAVIHGLFGPDVDWPPADLTIEGDRDDLQWHAEEFEAGTSFAFLVTGTGQPSCKGCLYLFPTQSPSHDIEAFLWTRPDLDSGIARLIEEKIISWVESAWPFRHVAWPGRDCSLEDWHQYGYANYYSQLRD